METPALSDSMASSGSPAADPAATTRQSTAAGSAATGVDMTLALERAARVRAEAQVFGRDHILSVASHDLRGPLNAIHTWAHVLERKLGDADASLQRALAGIRAGVEQQVELIERIIDVPRMATRHLALHRDDVALKPLCEDMLANARITLGPGDITLEWNGEAVHANADRERLWQAWWCVLAFARQLEGEAASSAAALAGGGETSEVLHLRVSIEQGNCVTTLTTAAPALERAAIEQGLALPRRVADAHGGQCSVEQNEEASELTITYMFPLSVRT
jgi:K+-sensing histidine kinase KdpD